MVQITQEQRENCQKLIDYLRSGNLKAKFNINLFSSVEIEKPNTCGSVGCGIGQGPYAGIAKLRNEDWPDYAQRVFGISSELAAGNIAKCNKFYLYTFCSYWYRYDNTPEGVANRLEKVLKGEVTVEMLEADKGDLLPWKKEESDDF